MTALYYILFLLELVFVGYMAYKTGEQSGHIKGYKKAERDILTLINKMTDELVDELKVKNKTNGKTGKAN